MRKKHIKTLETYIDWLNKAKYEYELYLKSSNIYDLTNCLLTLNAIPEWIFASELATEKLRTIAKEKIAIMKGNNKKFILDEEKLDKINHQLRLIRMFCNHAKHDDKRYIPSINMGARFPITFPCKFNNIKVNNKYIQVEPILKSIILFWEKKINFYQ